MGVTHLWNIYFARWSSGVSGCLAASAATKAGKATKASLILLIVGYLLMSTPNLKNIDRQHTHSLYSLYNSQYL